jgi:hypothetical protein
LDINTSEFLAGCNRYGLDNPCPFVTKRISLYGNDEDFEDLVRRELVRSNATIQAKMHTGRQIKGVNIKV